MASLCSLVQAPQLGFPRNLVNLGGGHFGASCPCKTPSRPYVALETQSTRLVRLEATFRPSEAQTADSLSPAELTPTLETTTADASPGAFLPSETASLTRAMYSSMQTRAALSTATTTGGRSASRGSGGSAGVSPLLIIAATLATAGAAAMRNRVRTVRECSSCRGYGVQRCRLCSGKGTIDWEGKLAHREPCPMCLGRRMIKCSCCGGGPFLARALFNHKANRGEAAMLAQLQNLAESPGPRKKPTLLQKLRRGGGVGVNQEDDRIQQSDQLAEQIMMD